MVRESLFQNEALRQFQDALDELEPAEWEKRGKAVSPHSQLKKRGWGFIPRHLMDKQEVFLEY